MLFCNYRSGEDCCIKIDEDAVQFVNKSKFLGVILDSKLTFESHISYVVNKMAKLAGLFNKIKLKICKQTFMSLYYTFVYPYLMYCNTTWGSAAKVYLNKITVMQKRILRIMFNAKYRESTERLYNETSILNI